VGVVTLIVGGARSGKSSLAVEIGRRHGGAVIVVATAEPLDDDMRERITRHRADRPEWPVMEAPVRLADAVTAADPDALLIVDCLTVWVANEMHHGSEPDVNAVAAALSRRAGPAVVVSNEVGLGVHPESELGRRYRDELGRANQAIAANADCTLLMVAGRAVRLDDPWKLLP
jgi:adenosyl cobinamide kinase/adenosyl cobinamide phosphate guanylyltransferase